MLTQQSGKFAKALQEITDAAAGVLSVTQDYFGRKCQIAHMLQRCAVYASFKALMNRFTFLFDGNDAGNCKLKPISLTCQKHKDPQEYYQTFTARCVHD